MNDQIITPEQKKAYIFEALIKSGFKRVNEMEIFTKEHDGKRIIVADLTAGKSVVFKEGTTRISTDDEEGTLLNVSKIITDAEDGKMPTKSDADEVVHVPKKDEPTPAHMPESSEPEVFDPPEPTLIDNPLAEIIKPSTLSTQQDLSVATIIKYINPKATEEEAYVFLQLCRARGLNPFLKEAHLIKYSHTSPASMVVGKDAFTRKAEEHKQFDGFEAGILVRVAEDTPLVERVGAFVEEGETLLGGWAKVHRKDHKHPSICKVSMSEYSKPGRNGKTNNWDTIPATMIRKVALVQSLRESFPSELSGMYDSSEMDVEASA